jgi:hypothetical protein
VSAQVAVTANVQPAGSAKSVVVSNPNIDALLGNLPTAHRAPIGHRIAGHGCHGAKKTVGTADVRPSASVARAPRIRFVYFPVIGENDPRAAYHLHLVTAEVLLDRVLGARSVGLRPMAPALDYAAEALATVRPPLKLFYASTLEYRRWYEDDGTARPQPLTQEALATRMAATGGVSMEEARHRAAHRSHALAAADQAWLIDRRTTPLDRRPLNQAEFQTLVTAIEGAYRVPVSVAHVERANRQIALRVAAMLGSLLDEFIASPFKIPALSQAFSELHLAHLHQSIETSRQAASASDVSRSGTKALFAAKAARMRAEHQVGLATSAGTFPAIRLSAYPVVAVVGGKLRTFVNGWNRSRSRAADAFPKSSSVV